MDVSGTYGVRPRGEARHGRRTLHTTLRQPPRTCERVPDTAKSAVYW